MTKHLSDEKLAHMGLFRDPQGILRPIGTKVSERVQKAEEAAENKPKPLIEIAGYDDGFSDAMHTQVPELEPDYTDEPAAKWELVTDGFTIEQGTFQYADEEKTKVAFVPEKKTRRKSATTQEIKIDGIKKYIAGVDPVSSEHNATITAIDGNGIAHIVDSKLTVPFPHLIEEMKEVAKYYGNNMLQEKKRCFIGVDNGSSGSVGIIFDDGTYTYCKTPVVSQLNYTKEKKNITRINVTKLTELLSVAGPGSMVLIERPMVNPKMFQATISAVRVYESTITILEALRLPYAVLDSKQWQKEFLPAGTKGDALKPASLDVGNRLFPEISWVKHPDRDGMLIAAYCKKLYK